MSDVKKIITEEDLFYIMQALHSHKRSEIDYLISIKGLMSEEELYQYRQDIEERHEEIMRKLFESSE